MFTTKRVREMSWQVLEAKELLEEWMPILLKEKLMMHLMKI